MTHDDVLRLLRQIQGERTAAALAEELGVSPVYLGEIFKGKRGIGPKVLAALNLEVVYRKVA